MISHFLDDTCPGSEVNEIAGVEKAGGPFGVGDGWETNFAEENRAVGQVAADFNHGTGYTAKSWNPTGVNGAGDEDGLLRVEAGR